MCLNTIFLTFIFHNILFSTNHYDFVISQSAWPSAAKTVFLFIDFTKLSQIKSI